MWVIACPAHTAAAGIIWPHCVPSMALLYTQAVMFCCCNAVFDVQAAAPMAACYICRLTSVPGRFLPQKAKELGVAPGPLFGKLKAGIAVQGKDRLVQPDEAGPIPPPLPPRQPFLHTCTRISSLFKS